MASSINASTTTGLVSTADLSGILNLQSNGTTIATVQSTGFSLPTASTINAANTFGFKNRIINGGMVIDQRNAGAATANTINGYTLDRWAVGQDVSGKVIVQQNAGSVTPPTGFINYLGITSQSAYAVTSTQQFYLQQPIEGLNVADLGWGTANAKTVTLSFQVYSSLTGTFGGALKNSSTARSYPFSYSISVANTWTSISVTIAGDTSGTWLTTNGVGIYVAFGLGVGSTLSGTSGAWAGANYTSVTGATSVVGTSGATFYITGVQLEVGSQATSFDFRDYGREFILCQRYYEILGGGGFVGRATGATTAEGASTFCVTKRALPTITLINGTNTLLQLSVSVVSFSTLSATPSYNSSYMAIDGASGLTSGNLCIFYSSTKIASVSSEL
ncbi:hypothetical protein UFOVP1640_15 [uncultured Caudovirales phage]|uniref:Uncharacterized protein n=1 Tax=uncultured Caudovirales phage TaxID=2100421 RepID=A0A6J5S985_9CAUD|nr:hypothetical protein UFOVP1286_18 [uncultured Caudovirales phage]CAB4205557.1 hypothetical protein UFOVP1407_48 [uncultured Caudovirales phage]CAB4221614.1 hypothetical protein UFOVP1640_15 [uncultured Caudovirales phage]